jgi:hypothetical protein
MRSSSQIFAAGILALIFGFMLIIGTIGKKSIEGISLLLQEKGDIEISNLAVQKQQIHLDSVTVLSQSYGVVSNIQSKLMERISDLATVNQIRLYSMPKTHSYSDGTKNIHTLQIQIAGDLSNQLLAMKNFETSLTFIPLKSCDFSIKRKRKTKELIGRYVFQFISSNNPK